MQSFQYRQDFNAFKELMELFGNRDIQGHTDFWTIRGHSGQYMAILLNTGLYSTKLYRTVQDYTGKYITIKDFTLLYWTIKDNIGLYRTIEEFI